LPVGLTLTGPRHADHRVIAMAQSIAALAAGQSPAAGG
jgi:Asp-tRNA(Asn)/Glu-tRNA(Gln) amidotransferase A subunit family amidase